MTGVMIETATEWTWVTPHGRQFTAAIRAGTSDWNTINACNGTNDEYRIPEGLTGWAIDVGAHIGAATIPLLLDNPDLRVIAIEALPENAALLRRNLAMLGIDGRCTVIEAAAGADHSPTMIHYGPDSDPVHRFIGSSQERVADRLVVSTVTLEDALAQVGAERVTWMKMDCEGCEYRFLLSAALDRVDRIVGEVHFGIAALRELLSATHDVTGDRDFGPFEAVLR